MKTELDKEREEVEGMIPPHLKARDEQVRPGARISMPVFRDYSPEQKRAMAKYGITEVRVEQMKMLGQIGQMAKDIGIIETIKGTTLLTQDNLVVVMEAASKLATDPHRAIAKRLAAADMVVKCARALASVNTSSVKSDKTVVETVVEADKVRRRSFQPGMAVPIDAKKE